MLGVNQWRVSKIQASFTENIVSYELCGTHIDTLKKYHKILKKLVITDTFKNFIYDRQDTCHKLVLDVQTFCWKQE